MVVVILFQLLAEWEFVHGRSAGIDLASARGES